MVFPVVEGHLYYEEAVALYEYAAKITQGNILEIGNYRGYSTVMLGLGAKVNRTNPIIYSVDPHLPYRDKSGNNPNFQSKYGREDNEHFLQNIVKHNVHAVVFPISLSVEDVNITFDIGMAFIDGSHYFEDVVEHTLLVYENLVKDGFLIYHDSTYDGVAPVIDNLQRTGLASLVERVRGLTILRRLTERDDEDYDERIDKFTSRCGI